MAKKPVVRQALHFKGSEDLIISDSETGSPECTPPRKKILSLQQFAFVP
jgi:hypothetical protein